MRKLILLAAVVALLPSLLWAQTIEEKDTVKIREFSDLTNLGTIGTGDTSLQVAAYDPVTDSINERTSFNAILRGVQYVLSAGYGIDFTNLTFSVDTINEIASKDYVDNALDDVSATSSFAAYTADGTDTINFASSALGVRRISTAAVDSVGLQFAGAVAGGQYTILFQNPSSVHFGFPSTALFPNGSQIGVRTLADTVYTNLYYDGSNFVFNSTFGTAYSASSGGGGSNLGGANLTGTGFLADQIRTFPEEDYTIFPGAVGDDQFAHSSIHFFSTAWNGAKYYNWYTPYPSEADENPYLAYSSDGITWSDSGISNPLVPVPPPGDGSNYNSDTDFWYDSDTDTAYLFWRYKNASGNTDFFYMKSGDGRTVSDSTKIFSDLPDDEWASITIEKIDTVYHAWIVTIKDRPNYRLFHYAATSLDELENDTPDTCSLDNIPTGKGIWHVSIKYDSIYDQLLGVFNFTDTTSSGAPNSNGMHRFATSLDGIDWDVAEYDLMDELPTDNVTGFNYDQGYRSSFARLQAGEPIYDRFGGVGVGIMNWNWKFSMNPFFVVPKSGKTAGGYEAAASDIESIYSFYYRDSTFEGLPIAQVRIRDTLYNAFPAAKRGQLTWGNSGERLETLAGSDTIFITRWYDQENIGSQDDPPNYLSFYGDNQPIMARGPYSGQDSTWYIDFDRSLYHSVKSLTKNKTKGISFAGDYEKGVLYSWQGGAPYLGATGNSSAMNIQDSGGYTQTAPDSTQTVISAIWGTNSVIRFEKNQVASGSTTAVQDDNAYELPFSRWNTTAIDSSSFFEGQVCELVVWKNQPDTATLEIVEDTLIANFDLSIPDSGIDTLVYDDFTGSIASLDGRTPDEIESNIDSLWKDGSSNFTTDGSGNMTTGSDASANGLIKIGVDTTKTLILESTIDFNTSTGWGGLRWYQNGVRWTIRVVDSGGVIALYKNDGSDSKVEDTSYTYPGGDIVLKVEITETSIKVYVDDDLKFTHTTTNALSPDMNVGLRNQVLDNNDVEWRYFIATQE